MIQQVLIEFLNDNGVVYYGELTLGAFCSKALVVNKKSVLINLIYYGDHFYCNDCYGDKYRLRLESPDFLDQMESLLNRGHL